MSDFFTMEQLGKFDPVGIAFVKEALEAAGIEFVIREDSPPSTYSVARGRMAPAPVMFDVSVPAERLADAKAAIARWEKEAEEAALRDSGAPAPTADELAAEAKWNADQEASRTKQPGPLWPGLALIAVAGAIVGWILLHR